ncbi:hypothetical protein [Halarchaeum grantii]|nr:hypothetical protein [Halarchaeum grantii]
MTHTPTTDDSPTTTVAFACVQNWARRSSRFARRCDSRALHAVDEVTA